LSPVKLCHQSSFVTSQALSPVKLCHQSSFVTSQALSLVKLCHQSSFVTSQALSPVKLCHHSTFAPLNFVTLQVLSALKGTQGFIHCSFKVASLTTLNKQMLSSLARYDALSLVNHKAWLHLVCVHMVYICRALING
jgi:hypothetical protein